MATKRIILSVTLFTIILTLISFANSIPDHFLPPELNPCDENTHQSRCGIPINQPGHGAVELCGDCYICGFDDGVCPAWYSTGIKSEELINVTLRKGTTDRPDLDQEYQINYNTAGDACDFYGAEFDYAIRKDLKEDDWTIDASIGENTPMSARNDYVIAFCGNVSRRPSCDVCVDPDCKTDLFGTAYTYDEVSGVMPLQNAIVQILPAQDEEESHLYRNATSNADGSFEVENAYFGEVYVYCLAEGFTPTKRKVTLKPDKNIVDCRLEHAECNADCTVPSGLHYGVRVCSKYCEGINGCDYGHGFEIDNGAGYTINILDEPTPSGGLTFNKTDIMDAAHGRPQGYFHKFHEIIDEANEQVVLIGLETCNNYAVIRTYALFNVKADVQSLITRSFNKILPDGTPVFLNIIAYDR